MSFSGFLQHSLLVILGGGLGAWLRYAVGLAWARSIGAASAAAFPWATLTVNLIGSLAMGLLTGWLAAAMDRKAGGCCWASACWAVSPPFPPSAWML